MCTCGCVPDWRVSVYSLNLFKNLYDDDDDDDDVIALTFFLIFCRRPTRRRDFSKYLNLNY